MRKQGLRKEKLIIIEEDFCMGSNSSFMTRRKISNGSIVAAGSIVTMEFPEYSIIGGNPAGLIRSRME